MVAVTSRSWWRAKLPDIGAAASRFPLAVLIAATFTLFKLYHDYVGDAETRTLAALAASFLWAVAVDFYVESTAQPRSLRVLLWLAGNAVIALLFWLAWDLWLNQYLFLAGLLLLLAVAGQLGRSERNGSFWLFNHRLWLGAALALIAAVLFGAGLSIIVETLQLLFGLELPSRSHDYIWTVSLGFVAPVSFLAFAPRAFYDPITEREESDFTMRAVSALVTFVLVPLLLVYTAILFAYAAKIAFEASLPKGTLGSMVAGYLLVCVATLLLAYPIREKGSVLVRLFWRYWAWLAALPVLLLFLAVYRRIADYGVTEQRYVMVLIGVWILVLAAIRLWQGGNFDLRIVPGLFALFLLAASFGPGGAVGFSVMSQTGELQQILAAKGMLVDGRFIARKADENFRPSTRALRRPGPQHRMVLERASLFRAARAVVRRCIAESLRGGQDAGDDRAGGHSGAWPQARSVADARHRLLHALFRRAGGRGHHRCQLRSRPDRVSTSRPGAGSDTLTVGDG